MQSFILETVLTGLLVFVIVCVSAGAEGGRRHGGHRDRRRNRLCGALRSGESNAGHRESRNDLPIRRVPLSEKAQGVCDY